MYLVIDCHQGGPGLKFTTLKGVKEHFRWFESYQLGTSWIHFRGVEANHEGEKFICSPCERYEVAKVDGRKYKDVEHGWW